jgi:DNA-binding MarR family transcriptional regulator
VRKKLGASGTSGEDAGARMTSNPDAPWSTDLSQALIAFTIELDNEFEHRLAEAGGGARVVSLVMWSNLMRFVGDGITVAELPGAAGLPKGRMLSTLGGMERWRYVSVGSSKTKRDGYGSARGLRGDDVVRPTPAGRKAAEIWPALFEEIERRWAERFGRDAIDELASSLRAIVDRLDVDLPAYVPVVAGSDGMVAGFSPDESRQPAAGALPLAALLSKVLLAYTLEFERVSELSLPLSANVVRVLDEDGMLVRDLPLAAGVPKEATAMALTFLAKKGYVGVEDTSVSTKRVGLTRHGREAQDAYRRLQAETESQCEDEFGADAVRRLRSALQRVLDQRDGLSRGLEPHADGWRASKRYIEHTRAMIDDPRSALPHYPMVLPRGGWPDGS